jgi:hypothetical protein
MSVVTSILTFLTCLVLGLLVGGMLVIGTTLVSFWKSLSPSDFQVWFASYSHLGGRVMAWAGASLAAYRCIINGSRDGDLPGLFREHQRSVRAWRSIRFRGSVVARPMGDVALDSYRIWRSGLRRGTTSASAMSTTLGTALDALFLTSYLVFVWFLWREVGDG